MKRLLKFIASVTWHVVKNVGGFILAMAVVLGAFAGISWLLGAAVAYVTNVAPESAVKADGGSPTLMFGMLSLMVIVYAVLALSGLVKAAKWLRNRWLETT